jgi:hypothetical protein
LGGTLLAVSSAAVVFAVNSVGVITAVAAVTAATGFIAPSRAHRSQGAPV